MGRYRKVSLAAGCAVVLIAVAAARAGNEGAPRAQQSTSSVSLHIVVQGGAVLGLGGTLQEGKYYEEALIGFPASDRHGATLRLVSGKASNGGRHKWNVSGTRLAIDGGAVDDETRLMANVAGNDTPRVPVPPDLDDHWRSIEMFPALGSSSDCATTKASLEGMPGTFKLTRGTLLGEPPSKRFAREVAWVFRRDGEYVRDQAMSDRFRYVLRLKENWVTLKMTAANNPEEIVKFETSRFADRIELELMVGEPEPGEPQAGEALLDFALLATDVVKTTEKCPILTPHMPGTPTRRGSIHTMQPGKYCTGLRIAY